MVRVAVGEIWRSDTGGDGHDGFDEHYLVLTTQDDQTASTARIDVYCLERDEIFNVHERTFWRYSERVA